MVIMKMLLSTRIYSLVKNVSLVRRFSTRTALNSLEQQKERFEKFGKGLQFLYIYSSKSSWLDIDEKVFIDLGYYDSDAVSNAVNKPDVTRKVVLALHDSPGSHHTLLPVLAPLQNNGYRIIAPNFPGFGISSASTKRGDLLFNHTNNERSQLVLSLLQNLGISQIEMVIAHGSGVYPALTLASDEKAYLKIKSLVFVNPWPHKEFHLLLNNPRGSPYIPSLWDHPTSRQILKLVLYLTKSKFSFDCKTAAQLAYVWFLIRSLDFNEIGGLLLAVSVKDIPRLIIHSDDENYVESDVWREYMDMLKMNYEDRMIINNENKIKKRGPKGFNQNVSIECDHALLLKHSKIIIALITKFVNNVNQRHVT